MKRLSVICMAALLLLAMSCKKNEEKPLGGEVCFRGYLETQSGSSKTHLDGTKVLWDGNDVITVVNGQETPVAWDFTVVEINPEDGSKADFVSSEHGVPEGFFTPDYKAYYPASMYDKATGKVSLPSEQVYKAGSFYPGYSPMVAQSDDENLYFKNICGVLVIPLTGKNPVEKITVTSVAGEPLWGAAEIAMEEDKYDEDMRPTFGTLENGGNSVTLNCHGEPLDATIAKKFYIVLPPITLTEGFEVKVIDSKGHEFTRNSKPNIVIKMDTIKNMAKLDLKDYPKGAIPGLFSVSSTKQVYFSQGNLQYQASSNTWRFAEHQWDMCDGRISTYAQAVIGYTEDTDEWIDLFGFGCNGVDNTATDPLYEFYQPWSTSTEHYGTDVRTNYYHYGPSVGADKPVAEWFLSVEKGSDWGCQAIINGGNIPKIWYTLTGAEWKYVIGIDGGRDNATNLKGRGKVEGVNGFILLPDDWSGTPDGLAEFNPNNIDYSKNIYSSSDWAKMEAAGAVFFPTAGIREGRQIRNVSREGRYHSSNPYIRGFRVDLSSPAMYQENLFIRNGSSTDVDPAGAFRCCGCSVRLAMEYVPEP